MTHTDVAGVQGHKRASWKPANTRAVFEQIMREHPNASRAEITARYCEAIEAEPDYLRTDLEYCCDNHMIAWERERASLRPVGRPRALASAISSEHNVEAATTHIRGLLLMSLVMPNNKQLGDCTGNDLSKIGGWCRLLRSKVGAKQIVRNVLTEEQLQAAWRKR